MGLLRLSVRGVSGAPAHPRRGPRSAVPAPTALPALFLTEALSAVVHGCLPLELRLPVGGDPCFIAAVGPEPGPVSGRTWYSVNISNRPRNESASILVPLDPELGMGSAPMDIPSPASRRPPTRSRPWAPAEGEGDAPGRAGGSRAGGQPGGGAACPASPLHVSGWRAQGRPDERPHPPAPPRPPVHGRAGGLSPGGR